jgi:hypothetical protein
MKHLLSLVFLCNISFGLYSQSIISGKVTGKDHDAVGFAPVLLKQTADSLVIAYTTTDENGCYKLPTNKKGNFFVQINCLGYASQMKQVELSEGKRISNFDFIMIEDATTLQEVVVKGRKTGIIFDSDTIRYDPRVFRDGSEAMLGDLLNKMPGIEVDEKGNIKAHGKQVDRLLLNGQDFFQGNTQVATKNLSADIAESIEIINNYSEYSLLSGFQSHEKTAMNVGISKEKFGKISGNISAGYGVENKYALKGNLMQIKPELMISVIGSANNNGDEIFSIEDYIRIQGGVSEFMENNSAQNAIILSKEEADLLIPRDNVYERNSGLAGLNFAYQPKNSLRIDSYLLYNENKENSEEHNTYTYLFPEQKQLITSNSLNSENENKLFGGFVKINYKPANLLNVLYKGLFSTTGMSENTNTSNRWNGQQVNAHGYIDAKSIGTKQNLTLMKSLGNHLLVSELSFSFDNKPFSYTMQSDSLLLPLALTRYDDYYYGRQSTKMKNITGNINFSFFHKINDSYFLRTALDASITKQDYLSEIFQAGLGGAENMLLDEDLRNDCSIKMNDYSINIRLAKNKGFFQFKFGVSSHLYEFNVEGIRDINNRNMVRFNPEIEMSFHFSNKHTLSFSGYKSDPLISADALISGIIFDSYQSYRHNSNVNKLCGIKYNLSLLYRIFDLFSNTMAVLIAGYGRTQDAHTINYYNDGLLTEHIPVLSVPTENYYSKFTVSKGLEFVPWTLKLVGGYNEDSFYNQSAGEDNKIRIRNMAGSFSIATNYRQVFDLECKAGIELFDNFSSLSSIKTQTIQHYAGKLKFNFNKHFRAHIEPEYVINRSSNLNMYEWYLNASIHYKPNDKIEINLFGANMLNLKNRDWATVSYNGIYVAERNFRQIPGHILLKLNYILN